MRAVFLIALVIGLALPSFTLAWTAPTASPPGNNVSSPINVSSTAQLKNGTLGVNALGVFGNTILNGTNGDGNNNGVNSYLNFGATTGQSGYGIRDNNGTLEFKSNSGSWGSLNATLVSLLTLNGITPNGLGQITSIKFADGTTESTANPWATNGTKIYYNGGNVGIGTNQPDNILSIQTSGETDDEENNVQFYDYTNAPISTGFTAMHARGTASAPLPLKSGDVFAGFSFHGYTGSPSVGVKGFSNGDNGTVRE
jgi:hypothetical protein